MRVSCRSSAWTALAALLLLPGCAWRDWFRAHPVLTEVARSERRWCAVAVGPGGRVFVGYPRETAADGPAVAVLRNGQPEPFPNAEWNRWGPGLAPPDHFVCVRALTVDRRGTLWILDGGATAGGGVAPVAAKLVGFSAPTGELVQTVALASSDLPAGSSLAGVCVDPARGVAVVADAGVPGLLVVDLASGRMRRRLGAHPSTCAEDRPVIVNSRAWCLPDGSRPRVHVSALALDPRREWLYYQALTSWQLYAVRVSDLLDDALSDEQLGGRLRLVAQPGVVSAMVFGDDGLLYLATPEDNAVKRLTRSGHVEIVVQNGRLDWPDGLACGPDGSLLLATSQRHLGNAAPGPFRLLRLSWYRPVSFGMAMDAEM